MVSLKRSLAITGTLVVMAALAPVASAGTERAFYLDKTCVEDLSEPLGYVCTVEHSDFKWIPAGTDIRYLSQSDNVVQARIEVANGSVDGACTWSTDVDAVCVFSAGSGRLSAFHLEVIVTANGDASIWYWNGTYSFGN
jgi:hypothetical protein